MVAMPPDEPVASSCPDTEEILADLKASNLLRVEPGERLWKLYCFRSAGHLTGLRHRIYTKIKPNGRLAMVTFVAHNPPNANGNGGRAPHAVRSKLARVPDLGLEDLDRIVAAIRRSQVAPDTCEELDLSQLETLAEQIAWLAAIGRSRERRTGGAPCS